MNHHHFLNHGSDSSDFWGAFFGAFFAFIFGFITYIVTKRRERFVEHRNALVKLERLLNKHLSDFGTLDVLLNGMNVAASNQQADISRLFKLEIPEGLDMELGSVALSNTFLTYQLIIDRTNHNTLSVNHALTRIEDMFISAPPVDPRNFDFMKKIVGDFKKDLPSVIEAAKIFLVLVRLHIRKTKDRSTFIYGVVNTTWEQDISDEEFKKEQQLLETEIKDIMSKDPNDIF